MKRLISLMLVLALVLSALSCAVFAEEPEAAVVPESALQQASARFEQAVQELGATILTCTRNILTQGGITVMTGTMLLGAKATQQIAQYSVDYYQKQLDEKWAVLEGPKAELDALDKQISNAKAVLNNWFASKQKKAEAQQLIDELTPLRDAKAEEVAPLQAAYDKVDEKLNGSAVDELIRGFLSGDLKDSTQAFLKFAVELLSGKITRAEITDAYNQATGILKALAAFAAIGRGEINQENIQTIVDMIRNLNVPVATRKLIIDKITEYMEFSYEAAKASLGTAFSSLSDIPGKILEVGKSFGGLIFSGIAP